MTNAILRGKPDAGNPHVRFDEGEVASAKPRRGSLLYKGNGGCEDLFRLRPFAHHLKDSVWRARRAGDRICIMARYAESQGGGPLRFLLSAFCSTGANLRPNPLVKGEPLRQRMHFGIAFENCVFEPTAGQFGAWVENDDDVLFRGCTFRTTGVKTPVKVVNATSVRVE